MTSEDKTTLTPEEKIRAAAAKLIYGTTDAEIALILGVTNHGRVNEAIKEFLVSRERVTMSIHKPDIKDYRDLAALIGRDMHHLKTGMQLVIKILLDEREVSPEMMELIQKWWDVKLGELDWLR
jgi:hypothetical protein